MPLPVVNHGEDEKQMEAVATAQTPYRALMMFGSSGSGKSTLLLRLHNRLSEADARALMLDCSCYEESDLRDVLESLSQQIPSAFANFNAALIRSGLQLDIGHNKAGRDFNATLSIGDFSSLQDDHRRRLRSVFHSDLRRVAAGDGLVILIDHFESAPKHVLDWIEKSVLSAVPSNERMRVLFASQKDDLPQGPWSPYVYRPSVRIKFVRDPQEWQRYFRETKGADIPHSHVAAYLDACRDGHDFIHMVEGFYANLARTA